MSLVTDVLERLRTLVLRAREERELDEELRFHLDMETDRNRALGLDTGEARRRGAIALGGVERVKEDVRDARGTRFVEDGLSDLGFALRTMRRSPGFTIVAVLTLALGIGGTAAVFSAVNAVLLEPLPYHEPDRLVRLYQNDTRHPDDRGFVTPVHYLAYRDRLSRTDAVAALETYDETGADIGSGDGVRRIRLLPVSADYFGVVRVEPRLGRGFTKAEETGAPVVVLSHELWAAQLHSDPAAIGRAFVMSGVPYTVAGVMPEGFTDPVAGRVDAWVPLDLREGLDASNADNHYLTVVARLRPTTPIAQAQAELDVLGQSLARDHPEAKETRAVLVPLKEDIVGSSSRALEIMLGAVGLVLALVCVNIANLLLVRGSERARELALRSALGAERGRIVRQLLIESLALALAGALAGLAVARLAMSAIVLLGKDSIPRLASLSLEPRVLAFVVIISSLSAIVFGLAPALHAARTQPSDALRGEARSATATAGQGRLRSALVVSQVALAFVLMVGAGLLLASVRELRQVPLGVRTDGVLTFELNLPDARYDSTARSRFYEQFAERIARIPGVRAVGGTSRLPATGDYNQWGTRALTGPLAGTRAEWTRPTPQQRIVSGDYFAALGIPIVAGRDFDARDEGGVPDHVIISQSLADHLFPGVDPLGQRLAAAGRAGEVIGVTPDVAADAEGRMEPTVYHAHRQYAGDRNWALTQVVAATGASDRSAASLEPAIRRLLAEMDPQLVLFRPMTLSDAIGRGAAQRSFTLWILLTFAAVALALAALGLFGVLSYTVKLREREFGIRRALGADGRSIRGMVMRQGLVVTAIGVVTGVLGATALSRVMASLVFRVSPMDPRVMAAAAVFLVLVAALAAYLPARRATAVHPRAVLQ